MGLCPIPHAPRPRPAPFQCLPRFQSSRSNRRQYRRGGGGWLDVRFGLPVGGWLGVSPQGRKACPLGKTLRHWRKRHQSPRTRQAAQNAPTGGGRAKEFYLGPPLPAIRRLERVFLGKPRNPRSEARF